jgi:hypothetical protein
MAKVKANPQQPMEMAVSPVPSAGEADSDINRKRIATWIQEKLRRDIEDMIRNKTLILPDVKVDQW